jgi:hypothetical protein
MEKLIFLRLFLEIFLKLVNILKWIWTFRYYRFKPIRPGSWSGTGPGFGSTQKIYGSGSEGPKSLRIPRIRNIGAQIISYSFYAAHRDKPELLSRFWRRYGGRAVVKYVPQRLKEVKANDDGAQADNSLLHITSTSVGSLFGATMTGRPCRWIQNVV